MKYKLKTKLFLSYLLLTLLLVASVSFLANFLLQKQFQAYVIDQQEKKNISVSQLMLNRYRDWGQSWNVADIENIGVSLLEEGLILKLVDPSGATIWDAMAHNNGMCSTMLMNMAENMHQYNPTFKGGYEEKEYPLVNGSTLVGTLQLGYYGPFFYTDSDIDFLTTLNRLLWGAAIFALLAALGLATWMSRQLTNPISRVVNTARLIAHGNFSNRVDIESDTKEMTELTSTINRLADTLGTQENLRKQLTADVAHELRTPLATLQSHLEAMIDGIWQPDQKRLKSCHEETLRIGKLVGDLEKLARYESENLTLEKTCFDLLDMLQSLTANFEAQFSTKKIALSLHGSPQFLTADRDKIWQVFQNLLSNALKYTEEGGQVSITVGGNGTHVQVECKDTGIGIPVGDLPHIYERFYRTDKSRTRLTGGSGIGLTIAKSIIDAHGGTISAVSEVGQGTAFTVTLPREII